MSLLGIKSNENAWRRRLTDFVGLFFPHYCLGCAASLVKGEEILCTRCVLALPRTRYAADQNPVLEKFLGRLPVRYAWAFLKFRKAGIVQHLIHQLKYNGQPQVGIRLGTLLGAEISQTDLHRSIDCILPMPLHPLRERKRGYNQSAKFAEGLSTGLTIPCFEDAVRRTQNTASQTRKSKVERWENVKNAFEVVRPELLQGQRVLLVDDIITTGASLEACGQTLLAGGCRELSVACIAEAQ